MSVISVDSQTFDLEAKLESDMTVFVYFWAPWCGPCKATGPIFEGISNAEPGKYIKVNADESPGIAALYNVRSIPTVIAIRHGEEIGRTIGSKDLDFFIKNHI